LGKIVKWYVEGEIKDELMMEDNMSNIEQYNNDIFEKIKNINEYGQEFWYARELAKILEYTKWGNFKKVIDKAKETSQGKLYY